MKLVFEKYLGDGAYAFVYENDLGKYEIWEIPQYGGKERHYDTVSDYNNAVKITSSFT